MKHFGYRNWKAWAVWGILAPVAAAQSLIVETRVLGAERLDPQAILSASGVRVGQTFAKKDLDEAVQRLSATGMFASVDYRWDAAGPGKSGDIVTWRIGEAPPKLTVLLDIPGIDEREFWKETSSASLMRSRIPESDAATAYCEHVVEAFLLKRSRGEQIVSAMMTDLTRMEKIAMFHPANHPTVTAIRSLGSHTIAGLDAGEIPILFRLAHPPKVGGIRFVGNHLIDEAALGRVSRPPIVGKEYSEYNIRNILELNVRPLYDRKGRLTMRFLAVAMEESSGGSGAVVASVSIDEGPEWKPGKAELTEDELPAGDANGTAELRRFAPADWEHWGQVAASAQKSELALKHRGYLNARAIPVGLCRSGSEIVDLDIEVDKGPQSLFGTLQLIGLSPADRQQAAKQWKLQSGAPLDGLYIADYLRKEQRAWKARARSVSQELRPHPDGNVVDVILTFQ
jgi:hypothetical protein